MALVALTHHRSLAPRQCLVQWSSGPCSRSPGRVVLRVAQVLCASASRSRGRWCQPHVTVGNIADAYVVLHPHTPPCDARAPFRFDVLCRSPHTALLSSRAGVSAPRFSRWSYLYVRIFAFICAEKRTPACYSGLPALLCAWAYRTTLGVAQCRLAIGGLCL